ncbi:hypothetical protein EIP86_005355 [Pleurotus ostreatoroseus]|nr:hypothetical protein EIP86_005355 [Pleurotus ostreatoroseus]
MTRMASRRRLLLRCTATRADSLITVLRALCNPDIAALTTDEQEDRARAAELLLKVEERLRQTGVTTECASSNSTETSQNKQGLMSNLAVAEGAGDDSDGSMPALESEDSDDELDVVATN